MSGDLATMLERLRVLKPDLALRFGVSAIHVFGSRARGEERPESDLDLLVDFAPGAKPTLFSLARLNRALESALGVRVDVVARPNLNPRLAPHIEKDLVAARRLARPMLEDMRAYAREAADLLGKTVG